MGTTNEQVLNTVRENNIALLNALKEQQSQIANLNSALGKHEEVLTSLLKGQTAMSAVLSEEQEKRKAMEAARTARYDRIEAAIKEGRGITKEELMTSLNEAVGKLQPQQQQQEEEKKPFWKKALIATGSVLGVGLVVGGSAYLGASWAQQSPETAGKLLEGEALP